MQLGRPGDMATFRFFGCENFFLYPARVAVGFGRSIRARDLIGPIFLKGTVSGASLQLLHNAVIPGTWTKIVPAMRSAVRCWTSDNNISVRIVRFATRAKPFSVHLQNCENKKTTTLLASSCLSDRPPSHGRTRLPPDGFS